MEEIWKPIPDCENVFISNLGGIERISVKGKRVPGLLTPTGKPGYLMFTLWRTKKMRKMYLHRAVMMLFGEPAPEGMTHVCFKDKNPQNCRIDNLYWSSQAKRMSRRMEEKGYQKGEDHFLSILTADNVREMRKLYATGEWTHMKLGERYGVHYSTVGNIIAGRHWTHV